MGKGLEKVLEAFIASDSFEDGVIESTRHFGFYVVWLSPDGTWWCGHHASFTIDINHPDVLLFIPVLGHGDQFEQERDTLADLLRDAFKESVAEIGIKQ